MVDISSASVTDTYGAFLIGTYCALMLYGLVLHQSYHYYRVYATDARWIKALVTITLVLETVVTGLNINAGYNYLITNYSNPDLERPLYWVTEGMYLLSYRPIVYCSSLVSCHSQPMYALAADRTATHTHSSPRWYVFYVNAKAQYLTQPTSLACTIKIFQAHNITEALNFSYLVSARNAAATVADSFMTAVLIYSLRRSRTGIKRTDSMINVLVLYAINTGLLISAFNVLCLVFGFVFPQSFTYIAVDLVASRLYANSLLAATGMPRLTNIEHTTSLTSRKLIAESSHVHTEADGPFGTVYATPGPEPGAALQTHSTSMRAAPNEGWELRQMEGVPNFQPQSHLADMLCLSPARTSDEMAADKPTKSVFLHSMWSQHFDTQDPEDRNGVQEVWFAGHGSHCDIGGCPIPNDTPHTLGRIPLCWMVRTRFRTNTGIQFQAERLRNIGIDLAPLYHIVAE
ncbi:hypothetical protein LXA43DRAFT_1066381 [Ganoderma leucocontextum]|nr:hypothetical protein LXA43DRAFT_1066381 [Ganoderma leucocontextum]